MDYWGDQPVRRAPGRRRVGPEQEGEQSSLETGVINHGRVGVDNTSIEMGDNDGLHYGDETTVMKRITNHSQRGDK